MTDVATAASIWPVLVPTIAGGLIAALGGAIGPVVSHFLTARATRRDMRRQRFEDVIAAVYEHEHWLNLTRRATAFGEPLIVGAAPINKAIATALLHFSDFMPALRKLDVASTTYSQWISNAGHKRVTNEISSINDGFSEAYQVWLVAFVKFQEDAADYIKTHHGEL
ncbi:MULTISPECIES: hypothetical protein [unclassified Rhizobium]|uniref:hypothetical protein n=1 Tax=unclassified Rhizobium TaxID=2613769 RepID=UPI0025CD717F|nr:hypothetical protein [Rhizobium sp. UBA1881]